MNWIDIHNDLRIMRMAATKAIAVRPNAIGTQPGSCASLELLASTTIETASAGSVHSCDQPSNWYVTVVRPFACISAILELDRSATSLPSPQETAPCVS